MNQHRKALLILLRAVAVMGLSALAAVLMPHAWMDWFHQLAGLGTLPDLPVVGYATRSLSLFYVWIGVLALYMTFDLERHLPLIRFFSLTGVGAGFFLTGIDLFAGLPWWWTAAEGAFAVLYFGALWWLSDRLIRNGKSSP